MTSPEDLARTALSRVYEPALVEALRADSPLPGNRSADAMSISVAVREQSAMHDRPVVLSDMQMVSIYSLGDLIREIALYTAGATDE